MELSPEVTELKAAALEYAQAVEGLHYNSSNTDVHNRGGIAGQAITPHCAWQCGDTGNRLVTRPDGSVFLQEGVGPHAATLDRYSVAHVRLANALRAVS